MPPQPETGDALETLTEVDFEWKIKDFFSLSAKEDDFYRSPIFSFADSFWYLTIYPNGQTSVNSVGWIDLYLAREDHGAPKSVSFTLGIKDSFNLEDSCLQRKFSNGQREYGKLKYISRAELLKCKEDVMPSNILTILCKLKSHDNVVARNSVLGSMRKVSRNLLSIFADGKSADFTLTCKRRKWPVHKMILASRSEFFASMFHKTWANCTSGLLKLTEIDEDTLDSVLHFLYTGEVENLSDGNVCRIYVCAHLLNFVDLQMVCVEYLKRNMRMCIVFGALQIAHTYMEEDLKEVSMKFLIEEAGQIFETDEWKQFKAEKPALAMKILEKTLAKEEEINKRIKLMASTQKEQPI